MGSNSNNKTSLVTTRHQSKRFKEEQTKKK